MIHIINNRITREFCLQTAHQCSHNFLMPEYKKAKATIRNINHLRSILVKNKVEETKIELIINNYIHKLIPPGTKGYIRGQKFNSIIKDYLINLKLNKDRFILEFEKKNKIYYTDEIPDWTIYDKNKNMILIGMNQMDFWSGGQQKNRGNKYINYPNTQKCKLVSVLCNKIEFKRKNSIYKLFENGFKNNTICYKNNLANIIYNFFAL